MTEDEFFNEPPYRFLMRQLHSHRSTERDWEKIRVILSTQYNAAGPKRKVKPKDLIQLDIDRKTNKFVRDEELIKKVLKAWQPIKAQA